MSRIGKRELIIPENVTVDAKEDTITVKGPKGELNLELHNLVKVSVTDGKVSVTKKEDTIETKAIHGTTNSLIKNMIIGVTEGFTKKLEMVGVGYRFALSGNKIIVNAGYSNPVEVVVPSDIQVEVPNNTELSITGIDKQKVSEFAANIRKIRKPEPYKGKGIRYKDEYVRRKEGKKAA